MATSLAARVRSTFEKALAKGEVLLSPSTARVIDDKGVKFQILHAPTFGVKPTLAKPASAAAPPTPPATPPPAAAKPKPAKRFNPFLPAQADLVVGPVPDSNYQVVLNKFTVVPEHILLTTVDFRNQSCLLAPGELHALWRSLVDFEHGRNPWTPEGDPAAGGKRAFAFHNNGAQSGASVHHRHLQILPWADMPLAEAVRKTDVGLGTPFTLPSLPFVHSVLRLPASLRKTPGDGSIPERDLADMYAATYEAAYAPLGVSMAALREGYAACDPAFEDFHTAARSNNFAMTREFMFVVPRRLARPHDIHVHSMGVAGLLVAVSDKEVETITKVGPMALVAGGGYAWGEKE